MTVSGQGGAAMFRGVHHVAFGVSNLETSVEWFGRVFGIEPVYTNHVSGPALSAAVGIDDAELKVAWFWIHNVYVELLEYIPAGRPFDRSNNDIGTAHLSFTVENIQQAWADLRAKGIEVAGEPELVEGGGLHQHWYGYFKGPDGIQLELIQLPEGANRIHWAQDATTPA